MESHSKGLEELIAALNKFEGLLTLHNLDTTPSISSIQPIRQRLPPTLKMAALLVAELTRMKENTENDVAAPKSKITSLESENRMLRERAEKVDSLQEQLRNSRLELGKVTAQAPAPLDLSTIESKLDALRERAHKVDSLEQQLTCSRSELEKATAPPPAPLNLSILESKFEALRIHVEDATPTLARKEDVSGSI